MRNTATAAVIGLLVLGCSAGRVTSPADPCAFALAEHSGQAPIDAQIRRLQQSVRDAGKWQSLEKLGWLFVSKARTDYDPGFYNLAEQCALCMESKDPQRLSSSLLLRGHALHSLHRFKEAEELARRLVKERGAAFDFGLLGDSLLDQGMVNQAAEAYQKMVDLRPGMRAYSRAAQVRWFKGDLRSAIELMRMAARAGSPRTAEPTAWAYSRLSLYELQSGELEQALRSTEMALRMMPDYAPALLAQGRILLERGKSHLAADVLSRAAQLNPLPEYAWAASEALRAAGRADEAQAFEDLLKKRGAADDPRTFSLFLATRGESEQALALARRELENRHDIFTFDALAWALQAAGRLDEARTAMHSALAEGAQDARIFLHAGVIASRSGATRQADRFFDRALGMRQMLLPSEQALLAGFIEPSGEHPSDD